MNWIIQLIQLGWIMPKNGKKVEHNKHIVVNINLALSENEVGKQTQFNLTLNHGMRSNHSRGI